MCFSASASFISATVIGTVGICAIKKAKGTSFLTMAYIPLLFSFQQMTEGFVWLSFTHSFFINKHPLFVYTYLVFALFVWPIMLPLSVFIIEDNKRRRKILFIIMLIGIALSLFMLYCLLFQHVSASIKFLHIYYDVDYSVELPFFKNIVYIIPTVIPPFVSSLKKMKIFGGTIVLSYLITFLFFKENIVSVWCFFAAIISILILFIIQKIKEQEHTSSYKNDRQKV